MEIIAVLTILLQNMFFAKIHSLSLTGKLQRMFALENPLLVTKSN